MGRGLIFLLVALAVSVPLVSARTQKCSKPTIEVECTKDHVQCCPHDRKYCDNYNKCVSPPTPICKDSDCKGGKKCKDGSCQCPDDMKHYYGDKCNYCKQGKYYYNNKCNGKPQGSTGGSSSPSTAKAEAACINNAQNNFNIAITSDKKIVFKNVKFNVDGSFECNVVVQAASGGATIAEKVYVLPASEMAGSTGGSSSPSTAKAEAACINNAQNNFNIALTSDKKIVFKNVEFNVDGSFECNVAVQAASGGATIAEKVYVLPASEMAG